MAELYIVSRCKVDVCLHVQQWGRAYLNRHVGRVGSRLGFHIGDDSGPVTSLHKRHCSPAIVAVVGADGAVSEGG